jgi:hypothetical protein
MKRFLVGIALAVAATWWSGCDHESSVLDSYPPGTLETSTDLQYWSRASAPNVYISAVSMLTLSQFSGGGDGGCPTKTTSGNVDTYQGGCTSQGTTWVGTMVVDNGQPDGGTGSVRYTDFGIQQSQTCNGANVLVSSTFKGTFSQTTTSGEASFQVDLRSDSRAFDAGTCAPLVGTSAWDYKGTSNNVTNVWAGQGRVGDSIRGVVTAETTNELLGGSCGSEADTGTTTIHAGANTAVITYDGQTKCDSPGTVTWTLNGTSLGEVAGISCAIVTGPAGVPSLALLLAAGLLWRSRRNRRAAPRHR